jgi:hypothetical protein
VLALASAVAVLHGTAVLLLLTGSLLALRWPRLLLVHVPVALAILAIDLAGADCPLTDLELRLRARAGAPGYSGGFLGHYVTGPLGFPIHEASTRVGIYAIAIGLNACGYLALLRRSRGRARRSRGRRHPRGTNSTPGAGAPLSGARPGRPGRPRARGRPRATSGRSVAAGPGPARPAGPAR